MSRAKQCPPPRIPPPLAGRAGSRLHHPSHWLWKPPCESPGTHLTAECQGKEALTKQPLTSPSPSPAALSS